MDFLGFGGWEIFLIIMVALLIYGPGRIVEISRTMGKMLNSFRKTTSEFTNQLTKEIDEQKKLDEIKKVEISKIPKNNK